MKSYGWRLAIAHFNHQLRGASSDEDEAFVRETAGRLGLKFKAGHADVRLVSNTQGLSVEMAGRALRHKFLTQTASTLRFKKIALAHHADDQVELFFLRLLRGAGPEGLAGMKWTNPSPADSKLQLIRPLLQCTRDALQEFASSHGIGFREDTTNRDVEYPRNRVRHELLPMLRASYQPAVVLNVLRFMELLADETEVVSQTAGRIAKDGLSPFEQWHVALQRRWLRDQCLAAGISPEFELIEQLRRNPDTEIMVASERVVWRGQDGRVRSRSLVRSSHAANEIEVDLFRGRRHRTFAGTRLTWKMKPWKAGTDFLQRHTVGCEYFDAGQVGRSIRLRHWRPGDRFQPIGMKVPVKLQDLFTNAKVPRTQRSNLIIAATDGGEVFWVEGLRIADRFKIGPETRRCLEWRWARTAQAGAFRD
jgi:tRNA(Ile)-lysidine synthase